MTSPAATNLDVDPEGLAAAGRAVTEEGDALVSALDTLMSALSSGAQPGHDAAGANFGFAYQRNGQAVLSAAQAAGDACHNVGFGIGTSAANYSRAEAASTPGGGSTPLPAPPPVMTVNVGAMPSPNGPGIAEPMLWTVVVQFVGGLWPDGEPDQLRAAAAAWETFGRAISSGSAEIERTFGSMVCHTIPERDAMLAALRTMIDDFVGIGSQCDVIGGQLRSFADEVQTVQQAVRDILHRLSPSGLFSEVMDVLRGDNPLAVIKQAARDIDTVLNNMQRESDALSEGLQQGIGVLDQIVNNAEPLIRKEFVGWFGEDVGNPVATAVNDVIDVTYGLGKEAVVTADGLRQSLRTLVSDPGTFFEGLAKVGGALSPGYLAVQAATDPEGFRESKGILKGLIHYDDWNSDHPLRGLGANVFDVGSLFVGGGAGAAGKGGATAARAEGEAAAAAARGAVKDGASVASHAASSTEVAARSSKLADELNAVKLPETHAPTAQPGPSVLPESRPPVEPPATHDPAPTNNPTPRPPDPAPHTPEATPHAGDHTTPPPHEPDAPHTPTHETPTAPTQEHTPSDPVDQPSRNIDPPVSTYAPEAPQVASSLNDAFVAGHPTAELAQQVAEYSTHHVPAPIGGDTALADRVVLGKWDGQDGGYIGEARHNGGIYFDTGDDTWSAVGHGLSPEQAQSVGWQVNEQFLRTQMESHVGRIDYLLDRGKYSTLEEMAIDRAGSFSSMEVDFLKDNAAAYGYQRVGDSWIYMGGK